VKKSLIKLIEELDDEKLIRKLHCLVKAAIKKSSSAK